MSLPDPVKVQFGSGPKAVSGWLNYDCSPTLLAQRLPLVGTILRKRSETVFDRDVLYGDTRQRLPVAAQSVKYLYCSHTLEHLSLEDFRKTLKECRRVLAPGGVFRGVMPDLEVVVASYLNDQAPDRCSRMMQSSYLGTVSRSRGVMGLARNLWGNSRHLWLWDYAGTQAELAAAGFVGIRRARFHDSAFPVFEEIEEEDRWVDCLGFECFAPS